MFNFRALAIVNEERNIHGLRYNDYARYRKHCANKVHRLRQVLKITHGKGKEFKIPPPVALENLKDGHLMLLLYEAERAWAYAQELLNENIKAQDGAIRRHALSRFRKALSWVTELRDRSSALYQSSPPQLSPTAYAEVIVYSLMLHGRFQRTKDEYNPALKELSVCRAILDQLVATAKSSRDQALYTVFSDEIDPEIRHCAHEIGRSKAYDITAIVADLAPKNLESEVPGGAALLAAVKSSVASGSRRNQDLEPVVWEGKPVPIRSPELVDAFLRIQKTVGVLEGDRKQGSKAGTAEKTRTRHSSRGQLAAFDGALSALSDAEDLAKKLAESQQGNTNRTTSGPGARDAVFIHAFVSYQLLARRTQRDLLIADGLVQPAPPAPGVKALPTSTQKQPLDPRVYPAVIKTLDTVLQSLDQMRTLSITDESPDIAAALDMRILFTKAKRCDYLALAHAAVKNYAQAVALTQCGQLHLREAGALEDQGPATIPELFFYPLNAELSVAGQTKTFEEESLRFKRDWFAYNGGNVETDPAAAKKAKKPVFFDVAFNYIEPPMDDLRRRAGKEPLKVVQPETPTTTATRIAPPSSSVSGARSKVDVEDQEVDEEPTPPPSSTAPGVLSSLLGGWWGRR
ncbi:hypothetical protein FRB95_009849 [Tulasnella sp. JGI-2019a]|nr:hypothetical protein FRB95_009849 [Tulasnella sp. JGI-2019a]